MAINNKEFDDAGLKHLRPMQMCPFCEWTNNLNGRISIFHDHLRTDHTIEEITGDE